MIKIEKIKDFNDKRMDIFVRLTGAQLRNKLEPDKGILIAESPTVIEVALNSGIAPLALLTDERLINGSVAAIMDKLSEYSEKIGEDIPVYLCEKEVLRSLTGFELTRGALCAMRRPTLPTVEKLLKDAKRIAVLEGITDSTNIGALFRSAAALGLDAILTTPTCCDPLCRRAVRVSMGTIFQTRFTQIGETPADWPEKGVKLLQDLGFTVCAMALANDTVSIEDPDLLKKEKIALVLGTEGDGLNKATIAACDHTVKIPMSNGVDSLNVAAAGAIAFWQITRKAL